jgi:hypothetical protein
MAYNPNFSISQTLGTPNIITWTDTSVGSDGTIAKVRIYFLKADGSYFKNGSLNYFEYPYPADSTDIDILNRDYGLSITTEWLSSTNVVLYSKNYAMDFIAYTSNFINGLTQQETALPSIEFTVDYFQQKGHLQTLVDDANQAIALGADYKKAQVFLDQAYYITNNQTRFF